MLLFLCIELFIKKQNSMSSELNDLLLWLLQHYCAKVLGSYNKSLSLQYMWGVPVRKLHYSNKCE